MALCKRTRPLESPCTIEQLFELCYAFLSSFYNVTVALCVQERPLPLGSVIAGVTVNVMMIKFNVQRQDNVNVNFLYPSCIYCGVLCDLQHYLAYLKEHV